MIGALIAMALALAGSVGGLVYFARDAVVKSDKLGDMKEQRATLRAAAVNNSAALDRAVGEIDETRTRLERVIADQRRELKSIYDELEKTGDLEMRGRAAISGLRRMLSADMPHTDDPKADPND